MEASETGERKIPNILPIHGNANSMNLNPMILTNIQGSPYFKKDLFALKTVHEVIDEIYYKVEHLEPWERGSRKTSGQVGMCGGVRGVGAGGIVSTAYCCLFKLFTLKLTRKQVYLLLNHRDSPYIRGIGFMYVRYTQPPGDLWTWFKNYLDDEEEIDPKSGGGDVMTIGEMVRGMLRKLDWYQTMFPRIPVKMEKDIQAKLKAHRPRKQQTEPEGEGDENQEGIDGAVEGYSFEENSYDTLMAKHLDDQKTRADSRDSRRSEPAVVESPAKKSVSRGSSVRKESVDQRSHSKDKSKRESRQKSSSRKRSHSSTHTKKDSHESKRVKHSPDRRERKKSSDRKRSRERSVDRKRSRERKHSRDRDSRDRKTKDRKRSRDRKDSKERKRSKDRKKSHDRKNRHSRSRSRDRKRSKDRKEKKEKKDKKHKHKGKRSRSRDERHRKSSNSPKRKERKRSNSKHEEGEVKSDPESKSESPLTSGDKKTSPREPMCQSLADQKVKDTHTSESSGPQETDVEAADSRNIGASEPSIKVINLAASNETTNGIADDAQSPKKSPDETLESTIVSSKSDMSIAASAENESEATQLENQPIDDHESGVKKCLDKSTADAQKTTTQTNEEAA